MGRRATFQNFLTVTASPGIAARGLPARPSLKTSPRAGFPGASAPQGVCSLKAIPPRPPPRKPAGDMVVIWDFLIEPNQCFYLTASNVSIVGADNIRPKRIKKAKQFDPAANGRMLSAPTVAQRISLRKKPAVIHLLSNNSPCMILLFPGILIPGQEARRRQPNPAQPTRCHVSQEGTPNAARSPFRMLTLSCIHAIIFP